MKTYRIIYKETLIHAFDVDANSPEEAKEIFEQGMMDGTFDFSDGDIDDAEFKIKEIN